MDRLAVIEDSFGRVHDYLRISLTDNCNFRCFYCMPEEAHLFTAGSKLMQADEVYQLAKTFTDLGVKKIRLTGGEPLVRKDAAEIISSLGKLPVELVITTNGTRVADLLPAFKDAGIKTINVSLDTLQSEKFKFITRRDQFEQVRSNIELLLHYGISVKINTVVMKDLNEGEIKDFIEWTRYKPIQVRFIEFMPFSGNRWTSNKVVPLAEILRLIKEDFEVVPAEAFPNDTAKNFRIPGHQGSFAIISTMTMPFCSSCNRMRLTADGKLKNCLFSDSETDLLTALRHGEDIVPLIRSSIWAKKKELGGQLIPNFEELDTTLINNRSMISIGG